MAESTEETERKSKRVVSQQYATVAARKQQTQSTGHTGHLNLQTLDVAKIENEDWQALLKGERYQCQLIVGTGNSATDLRDVIVNINLSGIRLLDKKTEATINQFDIEQILQYSYSQQHQTFSFSYLEEGRYFVTHKFISPEFFEMHQYLGSAIAIVIKLKTQLKKSGPADAAAGTTTSTGSTSSASDSRPTSLPPPSRADRDAAGSASSSGPPTPTIVVNAPPASASAHHPSQDTLKRSSRAKSYFERKYRLPELSESAPNLSTGGDDDVPPLTPLDPTTPSSPGSPSQSPLSTPTATSAPAPVAAPVPTTSGAADRLTSLFLPPGSTPPPAPARTPSPAPPLTEAEAEKFSEGTIHKSSVTKSFLEEQYRRFTSEPAARTRPSPDGRRAYRMSMYDSRAAVSESNLADASATFSAASSPSTSTHEGDDDVTLRRDSKLGKGGSIRITFPELFSDFSKTLGRKKSKNATVSEMPDKMRRMSIYQQWNPDLMPATSTKTENGKTVLVRTMIDGKYQITAGTVDALIEALADENAPDSLYIDDFLLTFRNYLKPPMLFDKLYDRWCFKGMIIVENEKEREKRRKEDESIRVYDKETANLIRVRVSSVFKKWSERHWYDFDSDDMKVKLENLVEHMKKENLGAIAAQISAAYKKHAETWKQLEAVPTSSPDALGSLDFTTVVPKDVAQQLTLVSIKIYQRILPDEFVLHLWSPKETRAQMTQNLTRFIDRFNNVGYWVATEICKMTDLKKRIIVMEKFISVAKYCYRFQNFNDVIAILSGLNTIPIYRLKKTWAGLSQKAMATFKELESKMSPENNYKVYRAIEEEAKPPLIPFFGLYMKDLTFMNDGNQTVLGNDLINFEKLRSVMGKIMAIRVSQQSKYDFPVIEPLFHYCEAIYHKDEDELTDESYIIEPSNRRRRPSMSSISSDITASGVSVTDTDSSSLAPPTPQLGSSLAESFLEV